MNLKITCMLVSLLCCSFFCTAQGIYFTDAKIDKINSQIIINYNLTTSGKPYDKYRVELFYSTDQGKTFSSEPLKYVTGDIGSSIQRGNSKSVQWNYFMEDADFDGKNLVFKLTARKDMQAEETRILGLGGPEKALYSAVPGLGDYEVRSGKRYWIITAGTLTTMGAGLYVLGRANKQYQAYESATNSYDTYKQTKTIATVLITTAATAWLADIALVAIQGNKNKKAKNKILKDREEANKK
jgi:hypothetical protein